MVCVLMNNAYSEKYFDQTGKTGDISNMARIAMDVCAVNLQAGNFLKVVDIIHKVLPLMEKQRDEKNLSEGGMYLTITNYATLCGQCVQPLQSCIMIETVGRFGPVKHDKDLSKGCGPCHTRWSSRMMVRQPPDRLGLQFLGGLISLSRSSWPMSLSRL